MLYKKTISYIYWSWVLPHYLLIIVNDHPLFQISEKFGGVTKRKVYRGADKSLARPGRKQTRKYVRDAQDFNNIETRAAINFSLQGKAPKELHAILTETLACVLPGRAKDLSAPFYSESTNFIFLPSYR